MKLLSSLLCLLILASCSSTSNQTADLSQSLVIQNDPMLIRTECEQNKKAMACARFAYHLKKTNPDIYLKYTTMACELGDENSCFNMNQLKGRTFNYNMTILKRSEDQIFNCYAHYSDDIRASSVTLGEKENKILNVSALITTEGHLKKVTLDGHNLNAKMEKCVGEAFYSKKFIGADKDMMLSLTLMMPMKYKEKDMAKNTLDGLADSLKDLN